MYRAFRSNPLTKRMSQFNKVVSNQRMAANNHRAPETWLKYVGEKGTGLKESSVLDKQTQLEEALMMGLRLTEGFDYTALLSKIGYENDPLEGTIQTLIQEDYLTYKNGTLAPTYQGRLCLNSVLSYLFKSM